MCVYLRECMYNCVGSYGYKMPIYVQPCDSVCMILRAFVYLGMA